MASTSNDSTTDNTIEYPYFGKLYEYSFFAKSVGECGDDMSFYIAVENEVITDVKYYTEKGCSHTRLAGKSVSAKAKGCNIYEALRITPMDIIDDEKMLEKNGQHCAILAVTTFYNSISNYLLERE